MDKYGFIQERVWKNFSKFMIVKPTRLAGGSSMGYTRVVANPRLPSSRPLSSETMFQNTASLKAEFRRHLTGQLVNQPACFDFLIWIVTLGNTGQLL